MVLELYWMDWKRDKGLERVRYTLACSVLLYNTEREAGQSQRNLTPTSINTNGLVTCRKTTWELCYVLVEISKLIRNTAPRCSWGGCVHLVCRPDVCWAAAGLCRQPAVSGYHPHWLPRPGWPPRPTGGALHPTTRQTLPARRLWTQSVPEWQGRVG